MNLENITTDKPMIKKIKKNKPLYKKFLLFGQNMQDRPKFRSEKRKLKKQKWDKLIIYSNKQKKKYKRNKALDQILFKLPKFANRGKSMQKHFRTSYKMGKNFNLFYGGLSKRYLKTKIKNIIKNKKASIQFQKINFREVF